MADAMIEEQRADLYLYTARFFKTRKLASAAIEKGRIRLDGETIRKPSRKLRIGNVLTIATERGIPVVEIVGFHDKRLSFSEMPRLYVLIDAGGDPALAIFENQD